MGRWISVLADKASRETGSGAFIAEIDGLRFVAIFSVILFHLSCFVSAKSGTPQEIDPLNSLLSHGAIGVQLFFVISGFVIALPFARGHLQGGKLPRLRQYLLRRLTRLEPPYIVNLLIRAALILILTKEEGAHLLPHLLASIGYLHGIVYGGMSTINFVAWSLEVELQFYLLAPLLSTLFTIRSAPRRRGVTILLIACCSLAGHCIEGPRFDRSVLNYAHFFLTGFLLVDVYLAELSQRPEKSLRWDLVSLLSWGGLIALLYLGEKWEPFLVLPIFAAYCSAFKGTWSNWFFSRRPVYIMGGMCYTLYLYHFSVISALARPVLASGMLSGLPLWAVTSLAALALVPAVLITNWVMFVLIEKPCMGRDWHLRLVQWFRRGECLRWRKGKGRGSAAPEVTWPGSPS